MKVHFETFRDNALCANTEEAESLKRAAEIYRNLRGAGYVVIPYDEQGREYWMNEQGELVLKP